ncbi:RNA-binding domain-containing protein [Rhodococcoides yunnanense]|jgi:hypothetical protein|uniref:RNA-binding domain-containing protein n=1 Tax=Rhodococcoides yunnanense TaxID=278209 RepID=UPI0022B1A0D1|nr:RNA-binding domain-containing protein [Rhodococcus yunnanensis]MCZ4278628.1 putative DNA binding domain-containing protein [Rhodococcus yunnanensis]
MTSRGVESTQSDLNSRRYNFFARFSKAKDLDLALRTTENPTPLFFLVTDLNHADLRSVGFAICRLGKDRERQFLINGEVAAFFAPWKDFQRRSFNVMTDGLSALSDSAQTAIGQTNVRFTPSSKIVLLITDDPDAQSKINEWQSASTSPTTVITVQTSESDSNKTLQNLLSQLRSSLGERDLYKTQNPVTGDDFFGRQLMLKEAAAAILSDQNIAILGLRRSGKTSVLSELKRQLLAKRVILTLGDFQALEEDSISSLATSIAKNLIDDLRKAREYGHDVWIGDHNEQRIDEITPPELSDRIKRSAARNSSIRFVIAVDEIESAARFARRNPAQIRSLLGALRAAAQACENVSLAFSGVANRMFRSSTLGTGDDQVDNPMFGQVNSMYITAFHLGETRRLLKKLGRPMFLDWTTEAVSDVQQATGGMPYFVRNLASVTRELVSKARVEEFETYTIQSADVVTALNKWRSTAGSDWNALVDALELHYPEAANLLDPALTESEVNQWIKSDTATQDAAEDLTSLGLLEEVSGRYVRTGALRAMQTLQRKPSSLGPTSDFAAPNTEQGLLQRIETGESHTFELKESFRINTRTRTKDKEMETETARAVASLLNSAGGTLAVGVHDSGEIKGLSADLKLYGNDLDPFERWILGDLLGRRIDSNTISQLVEITWLKVRGALVAVLEVQSSSTPAWLDDEKLFVRIGNQTRELKGRDLAGFLASR